MGIDWILLVLIPAAGFIIGLNIYTMRTYRRFNADNLSDGLTGAQIARALLDNNGLTDIPVMESEGRLSDIYNLKDRTISLSRENYRSAGSDPARSRRLSDGSGTDGRAVGVAGSGLFLRDRNRNHVDSGCERFGKAIR